jgi:hypothetical protein
MNNKIIFVIGITIGIAIGFLGTLYYVSEEMVTIEKQLEETLLRYQFMQGASDRCAIAIGVLKPPYDLKDNFEYDAYAEGYNFMDAEINKTKTIK